MGLPPTFSISSAMSPIVAATGPVVVDGRKMLAERFSRGTHGCAIARRTRNRDQGEALTESLEGDGVPSAEVTMSYAIWVRPETDEKVVAAPAGRH